MIKIKDKNPLFGLIFLFTFLFVACPVNGRADVSLSGFQQLGDNSNLTVTYDQLRTSPFYFSLSSDVSLSSIDLNNVSGLEPDSSLVFFIDDVKVGTGSQGSASVAVNLSLAAGLHTLSLRGSCYDNGILTPCSGMGSSANISIDDLPERFVDPVTDLITGDLNTTYIGTNQSDGIEITGNTNRGIDLRNRADRLYIHGSTNNVYAINLGNGDDIIRIAGDKNSPLGLGNNNNQCQIDGNVNSGTLSGGNQDDVVKIKGDVKAPVELNGGTDAMEVLGNNNSRIEMGKGNDQLYVHGNVSGAGIDMGRGNDVLQIDGQISSSVNGGIGSDTLYVNMTESEWAISWQRYNVSSFETIICIDTVSTVDVDEDDFTFHEIVLNTVDPSQTSDARHFIQKYHLGDNNDSSDGYDLTDSTPYYPDEIDGTSVTIGFRLAAATTHLNIDFYRLRSLDFSNSIAIDNTQVGTIFEGGDSVDLTDDPYNLGVDGNWPAGLHQLKVISTRQGSWWSPEYDDFSWDEIIITPKTSTPSVDHYRIEHSSTGITCQVSTVTLRACANDDCSEEYGESVTATLTPPTSNPPNWIGGDTRTFIGHSDVMLQQTTLATLDLGLTALSPVATNVTRCYEDGVEGDCSIVFYNTGIFIDGDSDASTSDSDIGTQIAGKPSNVFPVAQIFQVRVLRTDDNSGACIASLVDNSNALFSYLVPEADNGLDDNSITLTSNIESEMLNSVGSTKELELDFNGDGAAAFWLTSVDAGKYQLKVAMEILVTDSDGNQLTNDGGVPTGETFYVSDISNAFVVRPLAVFAEAVGNKNAMDGSGEAYKKTGENFSLSFKSLAWTAARDGNNDGLWDSCGSSSLSDPSSGYARVPQWELGQPTVSLEKPSGGDSGTWTYGDGNIIIPTKVTTVSVANITYDQVGIVQLEQNGMNDFLEKSVSVCSPFIGRFYPDHFQLTQGVITNRVDSSCSSPSGFTYLGEDLQFNYLLTAKNSSGVATTNYVDDFAKFTGLGAVKYGSGGTYTVCAVNDPLGTPTTELSSRLPDISNIDASKTNGWAAGVATFSVNLNVSRDTAPDGPFDDARFGVYIQDGDGVEITTPDLDANTDTVMDHTQVANATVLRYGRLRLDNAHGSEMLDLPMLMSGEYWTGSAFSLNSDDLCTLLTESDLTLDSAEQTGISGTNTIRVKGVVTTSATIGSKPLIDGDGDMEFSAPGLGGDGWVDVELTVPAYLQFDWQGAGNENPTSRATFGIYQGNEHIIYIRETTWR